VLCEYLLQSAVSNKKLIRKYSNKKVPYTSLATNFTQRKVQTIRIRNGQIYRLIIKLFVVFRLNIIIFISYLYWITQRDGPNKKYIVMTLVILFLVVVMVVVIVEVVVLLLVL